MSAAVDVPSSTLAPEPIARKLAAEHRHTRRAVPHRPVALPANLSSKALPSSKVALPGKRAYVTFLLGDGDYVKGVVALAKSLKAVGSMYPLVVAVTSCVPLEHRKLLEKEGCLIREIEKVFPPESKTKYAMDYYIKNYTKLRIWLFDDYAKMIYLDADMLLFQNIDELFEKPNGKFYAVMDCFCEGTWSHTLQHKLGWCQQEEARFPWPGQPHEKPHKYFNAGMFVFEPSKHTFREMIQKVNEWPPTPFAEQDFLNRFFQDSYEPIPNCYNLVLAMLWRHPKNVDVDNVKNVHYCAKGSKPWRFEPEAENMDSPVVKRLVDHWWGVYSEVPNQQPITRQLSYESTQLNVTDQMAAAA